MYVHRSYTFEFFIFLFGRHLYLINFPIIKTNIQFLFIFWVLHNQSLRGIYFNPKSFELFFLTFFDFPTFNWTNIIRGTIATLFPRHSTIEKIRTYSRDWVSVTSDENKCLELRIEIKVLHTFGWVNLDWIDAKFSHLCWSFRN